MAFGRPRRPSGLSIRDVAEYRLPAQKYSEEPFDGVSVDIARAAEGLGVSQKAVRDVIAGAQAKLSDMVFRHLSGRGEASTAPDASARGMLQAAFGRGPRGAAVNAKAAAQVLGVSPGTVRRWAAGTQQPSAARLSALRNAARRSTTTKRGRKAAVDEFRNSAAGKAALDGGTTFWAYGFQGPSGPPGPPPKEQPYKRDGRMVHHPIDAQMVEDMLRRYEERGMAGFRDWLEIVGKDYMGGPGWDFTDLEDLGFGNR